MTFAQYTANASSVVNVEFMPPQSIINLNNVTNNTYGYTYGSTNAAYSNAGDFLKGNRGHSVGTDYILGNNSQYFNLLSQNFYAMAMANPKVSFYASTGSLDNSALGIVGGHAYEIIPLPGNNSFNIINPYNRAVTTTITRAEFELYFNQVFATEYAIS